MPRIEALDAVDAVHHEVFVRHRHDRDRHLLQIRGAPSRGDDDFFEAAALRACALPLLRECRLGAGDAKQRDAGHG
jgi:hypothetical protein